MIGDGGQKFVQQIAVCAVQLDGFNAHGIGTLGGFDEGLFDALEASDIQLVGWGFLRQVGNG